MPIAKINDDGTVKVFNSKTGEIRDVKPEELGKLSPKLVAQYVQMTMPELKTGAPAVAEVTQQGGQQFINQAKDMDARAAVAQQILQSGGVGKYRQLVDLKQLMTDKENEADVAQANLADQLKEIKNLFAGGSKPGGTGPIIGGIMESPIGQYIEPYLSEETIKQRSIIEKVKADYANMISGKVVSDREIARLEKFLPTSKKDESINLQNAAILADRLQKNRIIFEKAKREGLTVNQAYDKYAEEVGLNETKTSKSKNYDFEKYWK